MAPSPEPYSCLRCAARISSGRKRFARLALRWRRCTGPVSRCRRRRRTLKCATMVATAAMATAAAVPATTALEPCKRLERPIDAFCCAEFHCNAHMRCCAQVYSMAGVQHFLLNITVGPHSACALCKLPDAARRFITENGAHCGKRLINIIAGHHVHVLTAGRRLCLTQEHCSSIRPVRTQAQRKQSHLTNPTACELQCSSSGQHHALMRGHTV